MKFLGHDGQEMELEKVWGTTTATVVVEKRTDARRFVRRSKRLEDRASGGGNSPC